MNRKKLIGSLIFNFSFIIIAENKTIEAEYTLAFSEIINDLESLRLISKSQDEINKCSQFLFRINEINNNYELKHILDTEDVKEIMKMEEYLRLIYHFTK